MINPFKNILYLLLRVDCENSPATFLLSQYRTLGLVDKNLKSQAKSQTVNEHKLLKQTFFCYYLIQGRDRPASLTFP
jgi:hypothetical protein